MNYSFIIYGMMYIALFVTIASQIFISSSYNKYSKIKNKRGITGYDAIRRLLDENGLSNVKIVETKGYLTDHYDPNDKVIRLSSDVFHGDSIASVSVACHECGHAIQDKENYKFMRIRSRLVPIINFSSYVGYLSILLGILFSSYNLLWIGIFAEMVILLFQLVTLPVEINASCRALRELDYSHIFTSKELEQGKTMLVAAALTYVASIITSLIQIVRLILLFGRKED